MKNANKTVIINPSGRKIARIILFSLAALFIIIAFFSAWFMVGERQQAVVTTFGKATGVCEAGIHFKIPFIQKVHKVDVNVSKRLELGYRTDEKGNIIDSVEDESKMITGDFNIVNIDFFIDYKITDPVKFLFNSTNPETILLNLLQSQVRNVVGSSNVDDVLAQGRDNIQRIVKELTTQELEEYDIGLTLNSVNIQDSEPPNEAVSNAFKNVQNASQLAEKVINEAYAYKNTKEAEARAEIIKLRAEAEYAKENRINEAAIQIAKFEAIFTEYALNPNITKSRMYYEMIKDVLPDVKIYIDLTGDGGTLKLLPLDGLSN